MASVIGVDVSTKRLDVEIEGDKRQYMPFELSAQCECGGRLICDMTDNYLDYPIWGQEQTVSLFCRDCYSTMEVVIVPDVTVMVVRAR